MEMFVSIWDWFPFVFFAFFILVLNGLLMVLFYKETSLRQSHLNKLILNQSFGDMLIAFVLIPCYCASKFDRIHSGYISVIFAFFVHFSCFSLLLIGIERFSTLRNRFISIFDGRAPKSLVVLWTVAFLLMLIPMIVLISNSDEIQPISQNYSVFVVIILFLSLVFTLFILAMSGVYGVRSLQEKTNRLSEVRHVTEAVDIQYAISEGREHLDLMWKITLALLLCLLVSVSPWIYFVVRMNETMKGEVLFVFCSKALLNPIIVLCIVKDYQTAMFQFFGAHRFK